MSATGRLRRLLVVTTAMTYSLLLLGIYTAAVGAGLTCDARWPLCDGAVFGLFPANWPSFVEWFHRLIAMIVGFMILASAYGSVKWTNDRRLVGIIAVVVVLLPVQIWLGAETVLTYEAVALIAHFLTAVVIFGGLLLATIRTLDIQPDGRLITYMTGFTLLGLPILALISPTAVAVHDGTYQVAYNGLGLAIVSALAVTAAWAHRASPHDRRFARLSLASVSLAAVLIVAQLTVGRVASVLGLPAYIDIADMLVLPGTGVAFVLVVLGAWSAHRCRERVLGADVTA